MSLRAPDSVRTVDRWHVRVLLKSPTSIKGTVIISHVAKEGTWNAVAGPLTKPVESERLVFYVSMSLLDIFRKTASNMHRDSQSNAYHKELAGLVIDGCEESLVSHATNIPARHILEVVKDDNPS